MARKFNTAGPVRPAKDYCIPPLERLDLAEVLTLIRDERYFVLHAPRQTGKTSALLALRDLLNSGAEGDYRAVYVNVEVGQAAREDTGRALLAILGKLGSLAQVTPGGDRLSGQGPALLAEHGPDGALAAALSRWAQAESRPLVLLVDEIDALVGDTLISVLRQLRAGYTDRPDGFPHSVLLCGVRDVRDYRIHSSRHKEIITGGSAFNIKAESLRMGDFSVTETRRLLLQHTEESGQEFRPEALDTIWQQSQGQPWLVNAMAHGVCYRNKANRDRTRPITAEDVFVAREQLIRDRVTHLDQLADKLQEDRVRRVVEPLLAGAETRRLETRDLDYVRDLGLVARDDPLRIANPIYAEVVPRELTYGTQAGMNQDTAWYVDARGGLDADKLLAAFQRFFREHSEHWVERFEYREAGPQLLLQAFLQRLVNSGGRIEREYGLGRGRTDLLILWPRAGGLQKFVVECKLLHHGLERTIRDGIRQTLAYMDRCAAVSGHLVVFDRNEGRSWKERIFRREEQADGRSITVWGM